MQLHGGVAVRALIPYAIIASKNNRIETQVKQPFFPKSFTQLNSKNFVVQK